MIGGALASCEATAPPPAPQRPSAISDDGAKAIGRTIYECPMHPAEQSDRPGKCAKCGMDLKPEETASIESDGPRDVGSRPGGSGHHPH